MCSAATLKHGRLNTVVFCSTHTMKPHPTREDTPEARLRAQIEFVASALIYAKSTGRPVPDFGVSNKEALDDIKRRATLITCIS